MESKPQSNLEAGGDKQRVSVELQKEISSIKTLLSNFKEKFGVPFKYGIHRYFDKENKQDVTYHVVVVLGKVSPEKETAFGKFKFNILNFMYETYHFATPVVFCDKREEELLYPKLKVLFEEK